MPVLIFDFDSTLVQDEGLDALFHTTLAGRSDGDVLLETFQAITDRGMDGSLPYAESLRLRLDALHAHRDHVQATAQALADRITPSILRHLDFFQDRTREIHVVSGGFHELIEPAAARLTIPPGRVHAQRFLYDGGGRVVGLDPDTALARGGKPAAVAALGLDPASTWIIGDGATDLELRERGLASTFVAFTENCHRDAVVDAADHVVSSMDDLLTLLAGA